MHWMYSDESLREQMEKQHHRYVLAKQGEEFAAYLSYEPNCENTGKTKIHKIYILPSHQRKGIGKRLFDFVLTQARENGEKSRLPECQQEQQKCHRLLSTDGILSRQGRSKRHWQRFRNG